VTPTAASVASSTDRIVRERVAAARALLDCPILAAAEHGEDLALVRRHQAALKSTFATLLGYTLVLDSSFARLAKSPVTMDAPARPARRADGRALTPVVYTYLSLLCAALLSPHTGEQILISALIEQVQADAASINIAIIDTLEERRALVAALGQLIEWGVISETDGTTAGWGERRDEVLLTVHRPLLPQLLARRLADAISPADVLTAPVTTEPRKSLRRKLIENPLVRREYLTEAERDVLSRERTEQARLLAEHFGLVLEVRAEGALTYDPDTATGGSDLTFPGRGTVAWATLLLCGELSDRLEPEAGSIVMLPDGTAAAGVFAPQELVEQVLAELADKYGKAWGSSYVESPSRLLAEVIAFAGDMSLIRPVILPATRPATDADHRAAAQAADQEQDQADRPAEDHEVAATGIVLHPVVGRYRPAPTTTAPTRAQRRHAPMTGHDDPFTSAGTTP
jgi:uncharacterized protein (TIGR02678 family)